MKQLFTACSLFFLNLSFLLGQVPYTVTFPILDGSDDAEESVATGAVNLSSSDLEMTMESTQQIIGLRFAQLNIPQGASINSAYIQFTTDETDDVQTDLLIQGELNTNASAFSSSAMDISSRTTTMASVDWNNIPAWDMVGEAGPDQQTPDLTAVVQEILDQADWEAGNALAFIISGTGVRNAVSFNNGANAPARLVINYDVTEFPVEAFPVSLNSLWRYEDSGTDLGTSWTELSYDDSAWDFGQGELGYGDGDENTVLDFGGDPDNKIITYYFRKTFTVADPSVFDGLTLNLRRDDGAVVYLNGTELARSNMPSGAIDYLTLASTPIAGGDESALNTFELDNTLQAGENVLAVEIHQIGGNSSDISFDLSLTGDIILPPAIQLIHNAADPSLEFVDIWVDAFNLGNWVKFNGTTPVPFRAGTPYITDLPPGTHSIAVSPFLQDDYLWSATEITVENNKRYIAMATGVRDTMNFETTANGGEAIAFKFQVNEVPGPEGVGATESLPLLFHGVTDLPNIRLIAIGAGDATGDFPDGLPYGFDILGGTVDALPYPIVQVTNNLSTEIYGEYKVDLLPFTEEVITLFTSGFFTPDGDEGVDESNFGLFIMPSAGGLAIELPQPDPPLPGKIQIIHDSPDPDLSEVDIWLNGEKAVEALAFREATAFVDIPAGTNRVAVAPHSTTMADTAWSATNIVVEADLDLTIFQPVGRTYTAVAYGARNTTPFENPTNADVSFGINVEEGRIEAADETVVDLRFFHGGTNAPAVDAILEGELIPIINDLSFGNYSPIYVTLPADASFTVNLTPGDNNDNVLFGYDLDLSGQGGKALIVLASGLLPLETSDPEFGLFIIDADGGAATPLDLVFVNEVAKLENASIKAFPNPVSDMLTIDGLEGSKQIRLLDTKGQVLQQWQTADTQALLDVSSYTNGVYWIELQQGDAIRLIRIVKQ